MQGAILVPFDDGTNVADVVGVTIYKNSTRDDALRIGAAGHPWGPPVTAMTAMTKCHYLSGYCDDKCHVVRGLAVVG